ncbi:Spy/CpxP family protein refolding chaperone [bacterium]|nr:Spy/CpxP family protein refolding chaperone [bacterium]
MKHKIIIPLLIVLFASPVLAQPEDRPPELMRKQLKELNLSPEQRDAMRELRSSTQKDMIDIRASMRKIRVDLDDMRKAESPDRAQFEKLNRQLADLRVRQAMLRFDAHQKMMEQLTPEQKEKFNDMMDGMRMNMKDRMRGKMKEHRGHGPRR